MLYFLKGFTMGLAYVAPIGLQNLFVINSALTQPRKRVYLTALIVIFFDITLALACFFGIGKIMEGHLWLQSLILLLGSLMVSWIGISLVRSKATLEQSKDSHKTISKVITSACVVTWFNPQAIIDGTLMLGAFKVTLAAGASTLFITGVMCASASWFLGLSTVLSVFHGRLNDTILTYINRICGFVIVFYGVNLFITFWKMPSWW